MRINWARELDEETFAKLSDNRILIESRTFESIADYTNSMPTSPSAGRVYRKRWPKRGWYVYFCETDPSDPKYTLHHPFKAEVVPE